MAAPTTIPGMSGSYMNSPDAMGMATQGSMPAGGLNGGLMAIIEQLSKLGLG
jgi:hypothetical protein